MGRHQCGLDTEKRCNASRIIGIHPVQGGVWVGIDGKLPYYWQLQNRGKNLLSHTKWWFLTVWL